VAHGEPYKDRKDDRLQEQCGIDIHGTILSVVKGTGESANDEWVSECEQQSDRNANQERSVNQTGQDEHLGLQFVHQLRLTSGRLQELATHQCDADGCANCTQTNDQTTSQSDETEDVFHDCSKV
jgi:hypothetical protein